MKNKIFQKSSLFILLGIISLSSQAATNPVAIESSQITRDPMFFYIYFPILLTIGIVLFFVTAALVQNYREKKKRVQVGVASSRDILNEDYVISPVGIYYDKTHTWAFMEKDGKVKMGIDDFLQHITGKLTRIKMKQPGEKIKKGKKVLSIIQEGKQLDLYSPVSGKIVETNDLLESNTSLINSSPYTEGWIYKVEPTNWFKEIQYLIDGNNYREWLKNEFLRLKEFLSGSLKPEPNYAHVLQDGGEVRDGLLMDLGPEVWEDFQTNFIDVSA